MAEHSGKHDYDLFVIGAGSGGVRAARIAAQHGARVAICDESRVGGTCVIRGCIPKKLLVYGAHVHEELEDAASYGWTIPAPQFDWPTLIANKDREIDRLNGIYIRLLKDAGCELIEGRGRIVDPHTVEVDGRRITAANILVAVGGWPSKPPVPGAELCGTSNEALELKTLPRRVVIAGGGYIAVEFAGIFRALGSEVTLIIRADKLLRGFDDDLRVELAKAMRAHGVTIVDRCNIERITKSGDSFTVRTEHGQDIDADFVLFATGRAPNTKGLGLEAAGVALDEAGAIVVDAHSRTNVPSIYAVGDVIDELQLTPVAIREGHAFADTVFGRKPWTADHANVPSAVFSMPPIGTVGLTEAEARESHAVDIYKTRFRPLKHTLTGREEFTFMKLVVDRKTDRVLGVHMVGADAPEVVQGFAVALKCGATKAQFDATVGIHPTVAEEFVTLRTKAPDPEHAAQPKAAE